MTELGLLARIAVLKHFIGGRSPEWVAEVEGVTVESVAQPASRPSRLRPSSECRWWEGGDP